MLQGSSKVHARLMNGKVRPCCRFRAMFMQISTPGSFVRERFLQSLDYLTRGHFGQDKVTQPYINLPTHTCCALMSHVVIDSESQSQIDATQPSPQYAGDEEYVRVGQVMKKPARKIEQAENVNT